jgi:hypothetical protein
VKALVLKITGGTLIILGCCAVAFGGLQAFLVWGGGNVSWPTEMPTLRRNLEFGVKIFTVAGVGSIALGFWLRRLKGASKDAAGGPLIDSR